MKNITIPWEVYDPMEEWRGGLIGPVHVRPEGVTISIEDNTVARLAKHFPGLAPAEAIERLFRGRT